jgi:hypothetical protein
MRILRGLSSRFLPCGCLAGIYETYDGEIVTVLDARGRACNNSAHSTGNTIPDERADPRAAAWLSAHRHDPPKTEPPS